MTDCLFRKNSGDRLHVGSGLGWAGLASISICLQGHFLSAKRKVLEKKSTLRSKKKNRRFSIACAHGDDFRN